MNNSITNTQSASLTKQVVNLSVPNALSQLLRLLTAFIATLMVARLGTLTLAASALGYMLYLNVLLFIIGINYAVGILVGKYFGSKNTKGISDLLKQSFWLMILLTTPCVLVFHYGYYIFLFFGQNSTLAKLAQPYLDGLTWGFWAIIFSSALQQFLLGLGRARILNFFALTGLIFSVIGFYALIFGHWGLPRLGLAGVGYSISIAAVINLILVISYILLHPETRKYVRLQGLLAVNFPVIKTIFQIGFPISVNMMAEIIAFFMIVFIIGVVNHFALAAYQVVSQIMYIPLMFPFAINQACAILTSQYVGKGQLHKVSSITRISIIVALIPVTICSLLFWLIPTPLINLFLQQHHLHSEMLIPMATKMLMITGVFQLIEVARLIGIGALRGLRDVKAPLYYSIISYWLVDISLAAFFGFVLKAGVVIIWLSGAVGTILCTLLVFRRLKQQLTSTKTIA